MSKEYRKVQLGAGVLVVVRLIGVGSVALACAVLMRLLGKEAVGIYTLSKMLPSFTAIIVMLSVSSNFSYFLNQPQWTAQKLWGFSLLWVLIIGGGAAIIWLLFSKFISVRLFHNLLSVNTVRLLSLGIPLMILQIFVRYLLQAMRRMRYYLLGQLNDMFLLGVLGIVAAFWPATADGIAVFVLIAIALNVSIQTILLVSVTGLPSFNFNFSETKRVISLGLQGYIGGMASLANYRLDVMLIGFFADVSTVGIYAIITKMAEIGRYFTVALTEFWMPYAARKNIEDAWLLSKKLFIRSWLITMVVMVLTAIASPLILPLFGRNLADEALLALYFLIIGMIIQGGNGPIMAYNISRGLPIRNTFAAMVGLIITIVLDIILIPKLGLNGAAIASMCSYSMFGIVLAGVFLLRKNRLEVWIKER